jgi:hypothetical protein
MRTPSGLYRTTPTIYACEMNDCPQCGHELVEMSYLNGLKTVQKMNEVSTIAYRPKRCLNTACEGTKISWPCASWQSIAPKYSIFGYDVIVQIGWDRQKEGVDFGRLHANLSGRIQISESQVRYLYQQRYLPLLACHERQHLSELAALGHRNVHPLAGVARLFASLDRTSARTTPAPIAGRLTKSAGRHSADLRRIVSGCHLVSRPGEDP